MAKQLNVNLAFNADTSKAKQQIQDLQNQLSAIINMPTTGLGTDIATKINQASRAAAELKVHLEKATNVKTGNLDFTKLKLYKNRENGDILLADLDTGVKIDKMIYLRIVNYLRKVHNITPKIERAANKTTKQILIDEDRMRIQTNKEK